MELRQLEVFLAVAEELHFGHAADLVGLSQPALTQAVARLERRLGARLFERTSRAVSLTPAGSALVDRARCLLADAASAETLVHRTAAGELGTVRLGVVGTALLEVFPQLVREVRRRHPGLVLEPVEQVGAAQVADLRAGRLDLGIVHAAAPATAGAGQWPDGLAGVPLRAERLSVAVPADHRLAHRTAILLTELRGDPLVAVRPEREADTLAGYLDACARAGFAPPAVTPVASLQALLGYVAAGLGWAFVAESVAAGLQRAGVTYLAVRDLEHRLPTSLVWPADRLAASARLVRDVAVQLAEQGPRDT